MAQYIFQLQLCVLLAFQANAEDERSQCVGESCDPAGNVLLQYNRTAETLKAVLLDSSESELDQMSSSSAKVTRASSLSKRQNHTRQGSSELQSINPLILGFEPEKWNHDAAIRLSHNCYMYALNIQDPKNIQKCDENLKRSKLPVDEQTVCSNLYHLPGFYWQTKEVALRAFAQTAWDCPHMLERVARDNEGVALWRNEAGGLLDHDDACPEGHYMAALAISSAPDIHFYRRDHKCLESDGLCWSHKPGADPVTRLDYSKNPMPDIRKADRRDVGWRRNGIDYVHRYEKICGYFCLPSKDGSKHSSGYHPSMPTSELMHFKIALRYQTFVRI